MKLQVTLPDPGTRLGGEGRGEAMPRGGTFPGGGTFGEKKEEQMVSHEWTWS